MSAEIICALITVIGGLVANIFAWRISRHTAKREVEKMRLTWEREDMVSSEDEFAEMVEKVFRLLHVSTRSNWADAAGKVAALRAKETGDLAAALDALYAALDRYSDAPLNISLCEELLTSVIEEKRKAKSHGKSTH